MAGAEDDDLYQQDVHALADAITAVINAGRSLDPVAAGVALGVVQALRGGAHNTRLWPERMAETAAWLARVALLDGGPQDVLNLDTVERDRFMIAFRTALMQLAGIELVAEQDRRPIDQ